MRCMKTNTFQCYLCKCQIKAQFLFHVLLVYLHQFPHVHAELSTLLDTFPGRIPRVLCPHGDGLGFCCVSRTQGLSLGGAQSTLLGILWGIRKHGLFLIMNMLEVTLQLVLNAAAEAAGILRVHHKQARCHVKGTGGLHNPKQVQSFVLIASSMFDLYGPIRGHWFPHWYVPSAWNWSSGN